MSFRRITRNTSVNTARYSIGLSIDHATPSTDDLYFTLTSRPIRRESKYLVRATSRRRISGWRCGGSEVWTAVSDVMARMEPFFAKALVSRLKRV
jgi:hypothetical protein